MLDHPIILAIGISSIGVAAFDFWGTLHRARRLRLPMLLLHAFLWPLLIAAGVAAIDHATATNALTYSDRLLRAAFAFAGAASIPAMPPEGLLLGLTRIAGRIYLVVAAFLFAAVFMQHRNSERRVG